MLSHPIDPYPLAGRYAVSTNSGIMWGTNGHPIQNTSIYRNIPLSRQMSMVKALGLRRYRIDLYEAAQQSQIMLRNTLAAGVTAGIEILPVIVPDYTIEADEASAYNTGKILMQTYASTFPTVLAWELGNEYELAAQISGEGEFITDYNPVLYVKARGMYLGMIAGMQAGNPNAKGCINTSGAGHFSWTDQLWVDGVRWDITGEHFYSDFGTLDITALPLVIGMTDKLALLRDNYGLPIWMTEFNYFGATSASDKPAMGDYLAKTMAEYDGFAKQYGLEAVDIYELIDQPELPDPQEANYGLYYGDAPALTINPAGEAVQKYLSTNPSIVYKTNI